MRARFWRNVALIALAHLALLVALLRYARESKAASAPEITWLSGGDETQPAEREIMPEPSVTEPTAFAEETPAPATSEIVLPSPTPTSTPRPTPESTPKKTKPTAAPEMTPKKKATPKPAASVVRKKQIAKKKESDNAIAGRANSKKTEGHAKESTGGSGDGNGTGAGKSDAATANYYGDMLHDRFYRAWAQPQTVVASGVKLSAIARIRIEKDGRVSSFKIVKPSGNVLVDESIAAAGKKVTQVDALPSGMGSGGHYDVNINFALNSN